MVFILCRCFPSTKLIKLTTNYSTSIGLPIALPHTHTHAFSKQLPKMLKKKALFDKFNPFYETILKVEAASENQSVRGDL